MPSSQLLDARERVQISKGLSLRTRILQENKGQKEEGPMGHRRVHTMSSWREVRRGYYKAILERRLLDPRRRHLLGVLSKVFMPGRRRRGKEQVRTHAGSSRKDVCELQ